MNPRTLSCESSSLVTARPWLNSPCFFFSLFPFFYIKSKNSHHVLTLQLTQTLIHIFCLWITLSFFLSLPWITYEDLWNQFSFFLDNTPPAEYKWTFSDKIKCLLLGPKWERQRTFWTDWRREQKTQIGSIISFSFSFSFSFLWRLLSKKRNENWVGNGKMGNFYLDRKRSQNLRMFWVV